MKNYYKLLPCIVLLMLFSGGLKSQNQIVPKTIKKTFYYSFENVQNATQIENLKNDVFALRGVTEVKSEYKSDSGKGQIIVTVIEKSRTSESDVLFDIRDLKHAIIRNNLTPFELSQEETTVEP